MADDFYQHSDRTMRLHGRHKNRSFAIGQDLTVRLDRVDIEEGEINFGI